MKKKELNKKSKKIIMLIIAILIGILIINSIINILERLSNNKEENQGILNSNDFNNIEDVLNYYGCKLIKEVKSKDTNFSKDIYVEFKYNTFEGEESKKKFYENVISNIIKVEKNNYRLIDESKKLLIEVKKYTNSNGTTNYYYIINGEENYFVNQESRLSLKNYKKVSTINLQINSNILNNLIQNKWQPINFGTKESNFEKYDIYFDEGIKVRKISEKVYNVIFTIKNEEEIVNGIKVGTTFEEIIKKLGKPIFGTQEENVIGYKNEDIYIFFSEEEISIYRNEEYNTQQFEKLLNKYINKEIDVKEFMNELTYLWKDYSSYTYDSNYINISYPLKGIKIEMQSDTSKGIEIYNNYQNISEIEEYINTNKITGKFEYDLVYLEEVARKNSDSEHLYLTSTQQEYNLIPSESNLYGYYIKGNQVNFISKDKTRPNETLNESINTSFWYTDTKYIYSIKNKGIYLYDLNNKTKTIIAEGNEEYTFEKYENDILTYDEGKTIQISN